MINKGIEELNAGTAEVGGVPGRHREAVEQGDCNNLAFGGVSWTLRHQAGPIWADS